LVLLVRNRNQPDKSQPFLMATSSKPPVPRNAPGSRPKDVLLEAIKKKFSEIAAKGVRDFLPIDVLEKKSDLFAFLVEKIPVKSHLATIIQREATRDFLVSEFLSKYGDSEKPKEPETVFTAKELLEKIGYSLSKPTDFKGIFDFAHFYKKGERICTMNNAKARFTNNHVFFLTHKNAANIPHAKDLDKSNLTPEWEHYLKKNGVTDINGIRPQREDPYGTSILSVQIDKRTGTFLRIINRYNHSVTEPDFTFGGDLDKLTPGLEQAIYRAAKFEKPPKRKHVSAIPANILAHDGKIYFYSQEREGVYWGDGFVYNNGRMTVVDPDSERVVDGYILSLKGTVTPPFTGDSTEPYLEGLKAVAFTKDTIEVVDKQGKRATLKTEGGCITSFHSDELTEAGNNFFRYNRTLTSLSAPNLKTAGNFFLFSNESLTSLELQNLTSVGNNFLRCNESLTSLELQSLTSVGRCFLFSNLSLTSLKLQNLTIAGYGFLYSNESLTSLELQNLTIAEDSFLYSNTSLTSLELQNLTIAEDSFLYSNRSLAFLSTPNLTSAGDYVLFSNRSLTSLELQNLTSAGDFFLYFNTSLTSLSAPNLTSAGNYCLHSNESLKLLLPKDFFHGICVSLEQMPSSAPAAIPFISVAARSKRASRNKPNNAK